MFRRWLLSKVGKKGVETIKSFHPHKKFTGQQTVADVKLGASLKKLKNVSEDYKDSIRKFGKTVDKATETIKKIKR
jgi:ERCC4-type nuclease